MPYEYVYKFLRSVGFVKVDERLEVMLRERMRKDSQRRREDDELSEALGKASLEKKDFISVKSEAATILLGLFAREESLILNVLMSKHV